jgi:GPH family glycoside/pentoside/hexuronide:cation symporter
MTAAAEAQPPRLGVATKALYGLGALSSSTKMGVMGLVLFFYNQLVGLDAPLVSLAIMIALLVDAFWDPIVGQISDSTRSRLGRRHPYIYAFALPASASLFLIYTPPLGWSDTAIFGYLLVFLVATRMFDSLVEIPITSLMPELTANYDQRTNIASWRYLYLTVIGRALTVVLAFQVFLRKTPHQKFGQLNMAGYAPYAMTVGAIALVAILIAGLSTQRFVPFMHRPPAKRPGFGAMARAAGMALSNRNFVALAVSGLIFGIAVGISGGLGFYFFTYFWELGSDELTQLGLWAIPGSLIGLMLAPWWSRRMGKKPACLIVFYMSIFSTTVPIGLRLLGVMPPNSSPWVLRILILDSLATGFLSTLGFVIVTSMLSDVVEEVQVATGRRSEGLLFAADSLLRKVTTSFAALLPGIILAVVTFPKHAQPGHVSETTLTHLAMIYLPVVTALYLCSTSMIFLYRIDRRRHEANLERIADAAVLAGESDPEVDPHLTTAVLTGRG